MRMAHDSEISKDLAAEYRNVGCFRLAWRNWQQNMQKPSLLISLPPTAFPTTQLGMFLQYWCTTTVLSKGLVSICRSSVERNAHLNDLIHGSPEFKSREWRDIQRRGRY